MSWPRFVPIFEPIRGIARPALHGLRSLPVHSQLFRQPGRGPCAVFLPASGPEGAALLRIHAIAGALRPLGWRTLVLPWRLTLAQRQRFLDRIRPDVIVMQGARHALNRPVLYPGVPIVFDMDDADFHLPHLAEPVRRAMPQVAAVIAGSRYVADWCRAAGAEQVHVVWTGSPVSAAPRVPQALRPPVIAWAQTRPATYLREAALVRRVTAALAARHPGITLRLYDRQKGDDPGFAQSFAQPGLTVEWRKTCRYSDYLQSFGDVSLGFAPLCPETPFSRGKSFGKVLAYLDRGVPVLASDACEHGRFFTPATGIVSNDEAVWVEAAARLLTRPDERQQIADRAFAAYAQRLSMPCAARRVADVLRAVIVECQT